MYSQNKISFAKMNASDIDLSKSFKSYEIIKISEDINSIGDGEKFTLAYERDYVFELQESRLFSNDYVAIIKKENTVEHKKLEELGFDGKYFLNADRSSTHQLALSSFENQYSFYVKSAGNEFYIEPLNKFVKFASADVYVYYQVEDIINEDELSCRVEDKNIHDLHHERNQLMQPNDGCKTVELNFCVDYSLYAIYNSINATINRTFEILNLTQLNYTIANGLAYDVSFKLNRHYILTCNNCNYWPSTNNLTTNNSKFLLFENYSQIFDIKSDIKVFWQDSYDPTPQAWGYGTQNSMQNCNPQDLLTNSGNASLRVILNNTNFTRAVLSHELGHNFGCQHIYESGTIMYAAGSTSNNWHPDSIAAINNKLTVSNCISDCQTELCYNERVENLVISTDDDNININWLSEIGMEYKLRLYNYTSNTWGSFTTVSYPQSTFAFPYNDDNTVCSSRYKMEIIPICSNVNGFSQLMVFNVPGIPNPDLSFQSITQNQVLCSGNTYTFSVIAQYPGTNPVYEWKRNNQVVGTNSPTFTTASLQHNDILSCQITSNDTCVLLSQTDSVSKMVAVMQQPCNLSNTEFEIDNIDFYPNPVKNNFTIKAQTEIKSVSIFNLLGQKLLDKSVENTETVLDLSNLSISTYFVKIEFDGFSKTIKVIKE